MGGRSKDSGGGRRHRSGGEPSALSIFARIDFPTFSNALKEDRWISRLSDGWAHRRPDYEAIVWRHGGRRQGTLRATGAHRLQSRGLRSTGDRGKPASMDLHHAGPAERKSSRNDVVRTGEMKRENPYRVGRIEFALPDMDDHQQGCLLGLSARASLCEVEQISLRPAPEPSHYAPPNKPSLTSPSITKPRRAVRPANRRRFYGNTVCEVARPHRPSIHAPRNKAMDSALRHTSAAMPVVRKQLQPHPGRRWTPAKYGRDLVAYTMYLNIDLDLPQLSIDSSMSKLFGLRLPRGGRTI